MSGYTASSGRAGVLELGRTPFSDAALALSHASADSDLGGPFVTAFGVTGAVVTTLGSPLGSETLSASDDIAGLVSEVQLDLGEGPGWEALQIQRPVLLSDLRRESNASWPLAWLAFREAGVGAVFAFPLVVMGINVGAVTLYNNTATTLSGLQIADAHHLARVLARQILRRALLATQASGRDAAAWNGDYSRRAVHQATGMIMAQMGVIPADAYLILRGHAFASGRAVRDVAADVIARSIEFRPPTEEGI